MTCRVLPLVVLLFACAVNAFRTVFPREQHRYGYGYVSRLNSSQRCLPVAPNRLTESLQTRTALGAAMKFRNFEEMLRTYHDKPVLVSFHATWCGPCKLMKKELKAVRQEVGDTLLMFVVDTERWPALGVRYHVKGLPTVVIFKEGEILYRYEGVEKAEELVRRVKALI